MSASGDAPSSGQLERLLSFLEQDSTIGPGNETKRRSSFPTYGRRSLIGPLTGIKENVGSLHPLPEDTAPKRLPSFLLPLTVKRGDTILFPSLQRKSGNNFGGTLVTIETALELRRILYGASIHSFGIEWRKSAFLFYSLEGKFPYGLQTLRCGSRALVLCVQGFLLKHLIFDREYKTAALLGVGALQPNSFERRRALIGGMCEMLWQAADRKKVVVCLKQEEVCFGYDFRYKTDSITEKLVLFEFKKFDELRNFMKRNLDKFQSEADNGCILFLYSLILTRTIHRIVTDMQTDQECKQRLLTDTEDCTPALVNLLLTGRATPYLHNGEFLYDRKGELLTRPQHGLKCRSHLGYMAWDKGEDEDNRTEVGSMLKTPLVPIWLTQVNGVFGLLFSLNPDLVNDWRIENRFNLCYYTGHPSQATPTYLSIETRIGRPRPKTGVIARREEEKRIPPLEQCIMTKWFGAAVNWNGTTPFV